MGSAIDVVPMAEAKRGHELHKYYTGQGRRSATELEGRQNAVLRPCTAEPLAMCGALTALAEVLVLRLGVSAASVTLSDGKTSHWLVRAEKRSGEELLGGLDDEKEVWYKLGQQTARPKSGLDRSPCLVIPDLSQNRCLKTLPFVMGSPSLRFYASAPIITKLGIKIGELSVVDTQIRQELSKQDRNVLIATAKDCMDQLETEREVELRRRVHKMNEALGSFIQSRATVAHRLKEPPYGKTSAKKAPSQSSPGNGEKTPVRHKSNASQRNRAGKVNESATASQYSSQEIDDKPGSIYKKTFRRAARYLRTALGVEGVLFADGLVGLHGDLQPGEEPVRELEREVAKDAEEYQTKGAQSSYTAVSNGAVEIDIDPDKSRSPNADNSGAEVDLAKRTFTSANYQQSGEMKRPAEILGVSLCANQSLAQQEQFTEDMLAFAGLTEDLLQQFLERHTTGEIFYYDAEGEPFRSEENPLVPNDDPHGDARMLSSLFPGTRQLIFSPLTDLVTQKRLAGCFAWSTRAVPVFTEGADLGPFKTFLHSVEAEISRVDTVAAVKQQEAFVSSVSHELRSPLHGILGAVELLSDTNMDNFQQDLTNTIRLCGTALHETLSSVLAYAKINEFERKQNQRRHQMVRESSWALENGKVGTVEQDINPQDLYVCTNVATLCEDIVEVVGTRHPLGTSNERTDKPTTSQSSTSEHHGSGKDASLALTLDVAYDSNWKFTTEPGAIRRVMMNIIGNALKYTPRGFVKVRLGIEHLDDSGNEADDEALPVQNVIFAVKDQGKGMSKDFLNNRLFMPFSQENAVASPGVGLGMSIVKSLVSLLGGRIDVESEVGKGTEVKVTLPMTAGMSDDRGVSPTSSRLEQDLLTLQNERLNVAMLGFAPSIEESLQAYLTGWCGCNVLPMDDATSKPDIIVIHQGKQQTFEGIRTQLEGYEPQLPTLIISSGLPNMKEARVSSQGHRNVHRISQPFGPNKIAKALVTCMDKMGVLQGPEHHGPKAHSQTDSATTPVGSATQSSDRGTRRPLSTEGAQPEASSTAASPWLENTTPGTPATENLSPENERATSFTRLANNTASITPPISNGTEAQGNKRSPRLLLVDDNVINLKLLKTYMKKIGHHDIETAANGQLAVQAAEDRAEGFDMIFMDISMPVMNGLEATRAIRRIEHDRFAASSPAFPAPSPAMVVALTGLASASEQTESFRSGVDSFITKPVRFESLKKLFEEWESRKLKGLSDGDGKKVDEGEEG